jgi:hypothetical protein
LLVAWPDLTHDEALLMLNDHVGEEISVWLTMQGEGGPWNVLPPFTGELGKLVLGSSGGVEAPTHAAVARAQSTIGPMYAVGGQPLTLPPLPGVIRRYEMGLEWKLAEGLTLRINWGGDALGEESETTIPAATDPRGEYGEGEPPEMV